MAEIAVDVEKKMMMKKGSCADDGFCLLFFVCLVGLVVLGSMLMKEKKKKKKMRKKMKKAAYKASDARFNDVLEDLFDLVLLDSFLNKEKKKNRKKKAAYKESEEEDGDDSTEADTDSNATLEDLFGLSGISEEEREKMKKPGMKGRGGVSIKEDDEGMTMKVEMPGFGKEDVKVSVVNNALRIETDDDDENENENENGKKKKKKNKWGMYLPDDEFKYEETKAVMKNGVLTVVVPKKKVEERKEAIHVVVVD